MSQQQDDLNTSCVEHGSWTAVPVAPPTNLEQFSLRLGDVDAAEYRVVRESRLVGDLQQPACLQVPRRPEGGW